MLAFLILGLVILIVLGMSLYFIGQDKNNPQITVHGDRIEILGFIKNRIIEPSDIEKISMDLIGVDRSDYEPSPDIVTFRFSIKGGKVLTLKQDLNPKEEIKERLVNFFKNRPNPTLAVYQLKNLLKGNDKIALDEYTKSYLETGNCDKLLKSRQV